MPNVVPTLIIALHLAMLPAAALWAQTLQSVVVGADVVVAIPPRGLMAPLSGLPVRLPMLSPLLPAATVAALPLAPAGAAAGMGAGTGLAAGALPLLLPVVAAVALGGGLPGSGGSGSAPASTR